MVTLISRRTVRNPVQIWGAPELIDDVNIFLNAGIQLTDSQELYFFGNYGSRENLGGFYFRNPNDRGGTFTDGGFRIVADTDLIPGVGGQVSTCPALPSPGGGGDGVPLDAVAVATGLRGTAGPASQLLADELRSAGWLYTEFRRRID